MNFSFPKLFNVKFLVIALTAVAICVNLFYLFAHNMSQRRMDWEIYEPGLQFAEFKPYLQGMRRAGFLTNKDLSRERNDGEWLQAQYFMAPTILEINNPNQRIYILDYTSSLYIGHAFRRYNIVPIADTKYSKVLAVKK